MRPHLKEKGKEYISPSQLDMFTRCGEQYRRRYMEGEIIPPGVALLKGTALHVGGAELNFKQKIKTRKDLPASQLVEASAAAFDNRIKVDGLLLSEDEKSVGKKKTVGAAKDSLALMVELFAEDVAPQYQPAEVEIKQRIVMPGPRDLLGRVDLITEDELIQDSKTSGAMKAQSVWDKDVKLSFYALTYQALKGKPPKGIAIDQLVHRNGSSTPARHKQVLTTRSRDDLQVVVNRFNAMCEALDKGIFMPCDAGSWACSSKYCGYWKTCPYVNSERVAAASANLFKDVAAVA